METGKGKENANRQKNMLDTVKINHVQHISFTQSRLTDAVSVILSALLSYEHPSKQPGSFCLVCFFQQHRGIFAVLPDHQ